MNNFTKEERIALFVLAAVIFIGSITNIALKKYPFLKDGINLIESESILPRVDINKADFEELLSLPYIGQYTAENIIKYREERGLFKTIDEIKNVKGIREKNYLKFCKYLIVSKTK